MITLEDLTQALAPIQADVGQIKTEMARRFNAVDQAIIGLGERIGGVEKHLSTMRQNLALVHQELGNIHQELANLTADYSAGLDRHRRQDKRLDDIERRLEALERR